MSSNLIRLAATTMESGVGAAAYGDVKYAMEAVKNRVNRAGGICGRQLAITYIDDGGDAQRGDRYLRNLARSQVFALAVVPSWPGLQSFIESGYVDRYQIPVVGTLGLSSAEFESPWVWAVGTAPGVWSRAVVLDANRRGARSYGIAFDKDEGKTFVPAARAYDAEVLRRTNEHVQGFTSDNECVKRYCGVQSGSAIFASEEREYYGAPVDVTALAMNPSDALTWMNDPAAPSARERRYDAAPALFNPTFAKNCQIKCDGMRVWSPYDSPADAEGAEMRRYTADVRKVNPRAEVNNPLVEGGYVGMLLLAQALARTGVDLTRAGLRDVLDTQTFQTGIAAPLHFESRSLRGARCVRSYEIQYRGTFAGWRRDSDWVCPE